MGKGVEKMKSSDDIVQKEVQDHIQGDSRVESSDVSVQVRDGVVFLTGTVSSFAARRAAEEDAWTVTGARSVENDIGVVHAARSVPENDGGADRGE
jgi:osmotically-inducible protein OsmY